MSDYMYNKNDAEIKGTYSPEQDEQINLREIFTACLSKWRWFVVSIAVILGIAVLYLMKTSPTYTRSMQVLVVDEKGGKSNMFDASGLSDLGLFKSTVSVNNELISMSSPSILTEVINRLQLDVNYTVDGMLRDRLLYGSSLPIKVQFVDLLDNESLALRVTIEPDSTYTITKMVVSGESINDINIVGRLEEYVDTPAGKVVVTPTANYNIYFEHDLGKEIKVSRTGLYNSVLKCQKKLSVSLHSKDADVIDFTYKDISTKRAEDVLNAIIDVYNESSVNDRKQIATFSSMFINERLKIIEKELGNVDENISAYKSSNLLPNVEGVANLYMSQSTTLQTQIMELNNQLYMARYIRSYLSDSQNNFQLIPANSGIGSSGVESQILAYNNQLLQRNNLVSNSGLNNPLVVDMDKTLSNLRNTIIGSIDNVITTLTSQIKSLEKSDKQATSKLAQNPTQAKYLLSVERQQKVKEALYLFLLQKREENELSQAFTKQNIKVIAPPSGSSNPTSPIKRNVIAIAPLVALCIPVGIIFLIMTFYTKIRGRKDLEKLSAPFAGEIPLVKEVHHQAKKGTAEFSNSVVVKSGSRDVVNEAFRVLRTNLEFMTKEGENENVMIITSFNPGSGKSFISMNLAMAFALKNKRVLVIDGDLRHASTSAYVGTPKVGLSDYLNCMADDVETLIVRDEQNPMLSVLPVGAIPPNPTELLFSERMEALIQAFRRKFDYILIDCPPVEIVADTQILEKLADRTLFVVRAGLLDRSMLPLIEENYKEGKYKKMSLVLNGTQPDGGRYGYKYGYKYGYNSGKYYNYGGYYGSNGRRGKNSLGV